MDETTSSYLTGLEHSRRLASTKPTISYNGLINSSPPVIQVGDHTFDKKVLGDLLSRLLKDYPELEI